MDLSIGNVSRMANSLDQLSRYLCPLIAKLMFLLLFGLVFMLSNYAILMICSSHHWTLVTWTQLILLIWVVFNLIFSYCMACFVSAGCP